MKMLSDKRRFFDLVSVVVEERILETVTAGAPLTVRAIVERTGFSQPTVRKYLARLTKRGVIEVRRLEGGTTLYSPVQGGAE